ncbi:MAG TPA: hypothetical protein DCQ97_00880 [Chitinophagaceae bacterium]|nr:hypothetical protein [Chitinophagaceae bacterium]
MTTVFIFKSTNTTFMSSIQQVRELTGLSQSQLAVWLGVSKSLVQFAEKGQRSLPQAALLKLSALVALAEGLKKEVRAVARPGDRLISNPGKLAARHKKKEEFHESSARALERQLLISKKKHPQLDNRLALFHALRNDAPEWYSVTEADITWMELTEWFSRDRMPLTGLEQQELLQDKIDMHLAYARLHRLQKERYEGMGEKRIG